MLTWPGDELVSGRPRSRLPRTGPARASSRLGLDLPHRLLGWVGANGFPEVVPFDGRVTGDGTIEVESAAGLPAGERRAGLLAHDYNAKLIGLEARQHTGWLVSDGSRGRTRRTQCRSSRRRRTRRAPARERIPRPSRAEEGAPRSSEIGPANGYWVDAKAVRTTRSTRGSRDERGGRSTSGCWFAGRGCSCGSRGLSSECRRARGSGRRSYAGRALRLGRMVAR